MGLLYRRFYHHSDLHTLLRLYCSFIRPHLEYTSIDWSPYLTKDISAIEKVQQFALRVCQKNWYLSYEDVLNLTSLTTLETRREHAGLCFLYNIVHHSMDFADAPVMPRNAHRYTRHTATIINFSSHAVVQIAIKIHFFPKLSHYGTLCLKKS